MFNFFDLTVNQKIRSIQFQSCELSEGIRMILVVFISNYGLVLDSSLYISWGRGVVQCALLHCDHEQIHDKQKIEKKLGLLGFGTHSDLKYLLVTLAPRIYRSRLQPKHT